MNKIALSEIGASALLVLGLTACSGQTPSVDASLPAPPTQTEIPYRTYPKAELTKMIGDVRDSNDVRLLAMPDDRLEDTMAQLQSVIANSTVQPSVCADFATGGGVQFEEGAVLSIGASASSNNDSAQLLTLISGVPEEKVKAVAADKATELAGCTEIQMSVMGQTINASTKAIPTSAETPGAVAYRTTMGGTGGAQDQLVVTAVKSGVVLISQSAGSKVADSDLPKIETMLDQAADLIK